MSPKPSGDSSDGSATKKGEAIIMETKIEIVNSFEKGETTTHIGRTLRLAHTTMAMIKTKITSMSTDCLSNAVKYSETAEVKCPYRDNQYSCDFSLQDREIKALLSPQAYEKHLNKSVKQAEGAMHNVFHCKTPDCPGFCQYEDNVNFFHCDVCKNLNCLTCQAQHEGKTCQEYQDDLAQKVDEAAMKTKKFFDVSVYLANSVMVSYIWNTKGILVPASTQTGMVGVGGLP
ncbi:RanBP-type and C3HC4-type zinc finger-containing protein 1 [Halocaridina rubra]|uniref:RanBP-type and C3HC4-type zinc finger-containing protein 1 n=1 Tax=Halocaridina rubra TaxID=373956 RepID=A0AAN8XLY4_HALRR